MQLVKCTTVHYLEKLLIRDTSHHPMVLSDAQIGIAITPPEILCQVLEIKDLDPAGVYDDVCRDLDVLEEDLGEETTLREALIYLKGE